VTWFIFFSGYDEKAYASRKKLILLVEGVESIGGIQGDHEYIEFNRDKLAQAIIALLQLFQRKQAGCASMGLPLY
jgi:hypothetical protein